ncbi:MAG: cytochrome-c peroxidase, partial [Candidatus Promineifilaceae bacterium]|nr:cytochrome-c peroxidase [Candidatus Promineifilaceae bacterium]
MKHRVAWLATLLLLAWLAGACTNNNERANSADNSAVGEWTEAEIRAIRSLWLDNLSELPPDPSNDVADDRQAAVLGQRLFFDPRFSANGAIACASCHQPDRYFTDGLAQAEALGRTDRGTPTIVGTAYSPWFYWDGRRDSQWAQALTPLEAAEEHGGTRVQFARFVADNPGYRSDYEALFGSLPDLSDDVRFPEIASPKGAPAARAAW